MKLKHNKKRNTAFLYETLIREVVLNSVKKNTEKRNTVIVLVKENFAKHTEIKKELSLYESLLETKNISIRKAEKLLNEIKKEHSKIDKKKLFREQSELIKVINKNVSKDVFSNFVPNYKNLATISQIFDEEISGKMRVILEEDIIKSMTSKPSAAKEKNNISNLELQTFISKFNETYDCLLEEHRELLNKYILSFLDNGIEFKIYLHEEIGRLYTTIIDSLSLKEIENDNLMKNKVNSVLEMIEGFKSTPISESLLKDILKIQTLAQEIKN